MVYEHYGYEQLGTREDISACLKLPSSIDVINCIKQNMGYTPGVPPARPPIIDDKILECLRTIMEHHNGPFERGAMILDTQKLLDMINEVLVCMGLSPIDFSPALQCAINCKQSVITDRINCLHNCLPPMGTVPPGQQQCFDSCRTKTDITDRTNCMRICTKM